MDEEKKRALIHCRYTIMGLVDSLKLTDSLYEKGVLLDDDLLRVLDDRVTKIRFLFVRRLCFVICG